MANQPQNYAIWMKNKNCPSMHKTKSLKLHCFSLTFSNQNSQKTHEGSSLPPHIAETHREQLHSSSHSGGHSSDHSGSHSEYHCNKSTKKTVQVKLLQWNPLDLNNQVKWTKGYEGLIKRKKCDNNTKITMLLKEARLLYNLSYINC